MPDPFIPQRVTVTDNFVGAGGAPLSGRVTFTPSVKVRTPDATIPRSPVTIKVTDGTLEVALIATDAASCTPSGWTYDVELILGPAGSSGALGTDAWLREAFSVQLPAVNPEVVLSELARVDTVRESQFEVRTVAGIAAGADGDVDLTAEDLASSGAGFASQASVTALTARTSVLEDHPPLHAARHAPGGADPLTGYIAATLLGASSGVATLGSDGKLTAGQIPAITISEYLGTVASEAAMLALTGQRGDWCIRTDLAAAFILNADTPAVLASWTQLPTPVDAVLSVAGRTGVVVLTKADVGLSSVDNTTDASKPISTATQTALDGVAWNQDASQLGDLISSIPRFAASSQDTVSNGFLTISGARTLRSQFSATKLRFHVRAVLGTPGIITMALYKGTTRTALAKVGSDLVVTGSFSAIGIKEVAIPSVTVAKDEWVYLAVLHTNGGTDPALSTLPGPPSADLISPTAAQTLSGYKGSQSATPATLDVSASFTASGRSVWFALAA